MFFFWLKLLKHNSVPLSKNTRLQGRKARSSQCVSDGWVEKTGPSLIFTFESCCDLAAKGSESSQITF
uniref:Uncharacterized protein n=1 Tax=Anguilla anguilla TaxID=7936 RepID=A0A0E9WQ99_ANGAN